MRTADLVADIAAAARRRLGSETDAETFVQRVESRIEHTADLLERLYPGADLAGLLEVVLDGLAARPEPLRALDRQRAAEPAWFLKEDVIGYVCYVDRFAGTLRGVLDHLDHLEALGVSYLHLMPLLRARDGENDGGYAVQDYDAVDPRLGTTADLSELADRLHERGVALCVDLVINHTAREHEWAQRALAGEPGYRDFYIAFPDRTLPDEYEKTLPDIFPGLSHGSFSYVEGLGWVWTTFRDFQWDLNYANPAVFRAMLATILRLANRGPDVLRIDAAPFLWKRLGTTSMDQPETHLLLQAFRALTWMAAPGLLLKAEAMLEPDALGRYLGDHDPYAPECDLAYDNQTMVMLWASLAEGDARLATEALGRRRPAPGGTTWVTYVRCHDDIGWAVSDVDAAAVGEDGPTLRRRLSDFYAGQVPGSFAHGEPFQANPEGAHAICGSAASLCGLAAGTDPEPALRRLESLYSVVFSIGGIPLIYMGDEIAMTNDERWADDPSHAGDNRWLQRPAMDWDAVRSGGVAADAMDRIRALAATRRRLPDLDASRPLRMLRAADPGLLAYRRGEAFLAAVNFTDRPIAIDEGLLPGVADPELVHGSATDPRTVPPYGFMWLRDRRR